MGPDEASGPEVIELGRAVGAECLARAQMSAAETKPMHEVVTPLIQSPDKEDPPAILATLVVHHVPAHAIRVRHMPERPPSSVQQLVSALCNILNHLNNRPQLLPRGLLKLQSQR